MKVLAAFDKFKDCLSAREACDTAAACLREKHPGWQVETCPLTDGGEGFCEILTQAANGQLHTIRVLDAQFREVPASYGTVQARNLPPDAATLLGLSRDAAGTVAIVEMAQASGLEQLARDDRNLWDASSCGTGQLMREACQRDATVLLLGIGGSATNDLGLGAMEALGAEFLGEDGPLPHITPGQFSQIVEIDLHSNLLPLPPIRIACDVDNPLLGPEGATSIFGPQKGLAVDSLPAMEAAVAHAANVLCETTGHDENALHMPGSGAAGGIGCGLHLATGAHFVKGFSLVAAWLGLERKIQEADLVLTGEGRLDASSLNGKGPWAILQQAAASGKPVHAFAGSVTDEVLEALPWGAHAHAIQPEGMALEDALAAGPELLAHAVDSFAHD